MNCFAEILPLYEAYKYLTQRFAKIRTSDFIKRSASNENNTSKDKWTCFCRISEMQNELDEAIKDDDLLKKYFTPLKTRNDLPGDRTLTIGGMLLSMPSAADKPLDYNEFVQYCKSANQLELLSMYYECALSPFFKDWNESGEAEISMAKFVSSVNEIVAETNDKWAIIDCASNPCEHLEKMRPLVTKVMDLIADKGRELLGFMSEELKELRSDSILEYKLGELLCTRIGPESLNKTNVYLSLFSFNDIDMAISNDSDPIEFKWLVLGIYLNTLFEFRRSNSNSETHLQILKLLSDQTRFNVLHELCDRESYGQELADKFGGARSAIYYHLEKLLGYGLLDLKMTEYRMLYTMNKAAVYDKLTAMRDYLVNGWKPEERE